MTPEISSLAKKFQIKAGMSLLVLNAPGDFPAMPPAGVTVATTGSGPFDAVHCFAQQHTELERYAPIRWPALCRTVCYGFYPPGHVGHPTDLSGQWLGRGHSTAGKAYARLLSTTSGPPCAFVLSRGS